MTATRLVLSRGTTRHNNQRHHQWCHRCSAKNTNNAPSLLFLDTSSSSRQSLLFRKSLMTRCSHTSSSNNNPRSSNSSSNHLSTKNSSFFLTPGFQPTFITGDNIGFYQGSTFYNSATPPNVLPTLNASPILSPGKYVRQSSANSTTWNTTNKHNNNNGTKSGTDAALRLVDARREFTSLMKRELLSGSSLQQHNTTNDDGSENKVAAAIKEDVRKLYALEGHGVPMELLSHLLQVVRGWTTTASSPPQSSLVVVTQQQNTSSSVVQVSFQNVSNSTLLNRDEIQVVYDNGYTTKLLTDENNNGNHHFNDIISIFCQSSQLNRPLESACLYYLLYSPDPSFQIEYSKFGF
mmetsp:Transcript_1037/g.1627  ORF Transcript_1037/g.1627 Transcript_1037/m.1627 type:complete len:350 (+) Transcript_1037:82-1131(+)|eukprot:CAMPEP_0201719414 /NCGR_PEP_ID=MMETSP0593-20130828/4619_1 /ASSEMBLY_ACC=CAM_ASM_000672 /TAXON_ID=267983 /ORGANISM="Skeletonema japonicum, Strain CCMP2506" /LENGTH=349 /DNA_ID=CAMNT_0048209849 /DNA_START=22 /DNA_END=1071 /DNA_ORIENTATION=-